MKQYYTRYQSIIGPLFLVCNDAGLIEILFADTFEEKYQYIKLDNHPILHITKEWLDGYFSGFHPDPNILPLLPKGTDFQKVVWKQVLTIPYGQVDTYGTIAKHVGLDLGKFKISAQAIGQAVAANPIPIVIPCHRVIGSNGNLTGYSGGLQKKMILLRHENESAKDSL